MLDYVERLICVGYCDHDCEEYYKCPHCGQEYTGWGLFRKGIQDGDKFKCIKCGNIIKH